MSHQPMFEIDYRCPSCGHEWREEWSCACDSECPECAQNDVEARDWRELDEVADSAALVTFRAELAAARTTQEMIAAYGALRRAMA